MTSQGLACPHCKAVVQTDPGPGHVCPACRRSLATATSTLVVASASAASWYYAQNNKKHGPVTLVLLRELVATGKLRLDAMVLQEGSRKWSPAATVPGLIAVSAAPIVMAPATRTAPSANGVPSGSPKPAATGWHYARDKQKHGPIARQLLEQLAATGQLLREDMVLPEESQTWVPAGSIDGLFPTISVDELLGTAPAELPKTLPRPRYVSPNACPHCKGTAYCGRHWDADGLLTRGPICAYCKHQSGIDPAQEVDKVTCAVCAGKGFKSEQEPPPAFRRDAVAWRLRGLAATDSGNYQEAIAAYDAAIRLAPRFADAYYERGWAYMAIGETAQGEEDLAEAARLSARYPAEAPTPEESSPSGGWLPRLFRRRDDR